MRPSALRPPLRRRGSSSERSGSALVMSVKSATDMPLRPAELGLYWRIGMMRFLHVLEEVDALALGERHVGLLPGRAAADVAADAARLAEHVERAHLLDLHLEQRLDGVTDLVLVRVAPHAEHHVVAGLVDQRPLLGDQRGSDDVVHARHALTLPLTAATAARVSTRCWWRRMSSTLAP